MHLKGSTAWLNWNNYSEYRKKRESSREKLRYLEDSVRMSNTHLNRVPEKEMRESARSTIHINIDWGFSRMNEISKSSGSGNPMNPNPNK